MRKYIKARILELLQSVTMGLEELAEVSPTEAVEILTEVQSAVINIGNIIEQKEVEKKAELIPCLEEFAEAAYRLAVDILEGREPSMRCQNLLKEARAIQKLVECKLEVMYRSFFFPIKYLCGTVWRVSIMLPCSMRTAMFQWYLSLTIICPGMVT